ncbi:MAG: ATP-binding protein [Lachnospiraceae bacterium]|nr:ATP-binding protein [Lachnospiraceae bacterium]
MFIGRKEELHFLEERYQASTAQLIVLYGRRRIGKTETLRHFCENKPHVFYSCTECTNELQLQAFSERMLKTGMPVRQYINTFSSWEQAFRSTLELPGNQKKLLVIDEFPYMVKNNAEIPSILQNLWDQLLKDSSVMIILCGSAMSFIEKEILAEKNPLYGRATGILKMKEMNFYDAIQFVPNYSPEEKIATYAILGGIPHYLKQFHDDIPLAENIKKNILTRGSILYSEVEFLMRQELRETTTYNTIITAIALGNTKLNDIYTKTQIEKTKLSVYLKNLTDLGILFREFPVSDKVKEQAKVQRGLYKLTDNFFRFWYSFVFPNLSELESGDTDGIWEYVIKEKIDDYISYIFENICIQYLRAKNRKNELSFHFSQIGRWWNKTDEIDIMATNADRTHFIIGECKYRNNPFPMSELKKLQQKFPCQTESDIIEYWLFSKSGFTEDLMSYEEKGIYQISLEEIVTFQS